MTLMLIIAGTVIFIAAIIAATRYTEARFQDHELSEVRRQREERRNIKRMHDMNRRPD